MNLSFLPNLITIIRIILLVPLSYLLVHEEYTTALIIFVVAGASDALDGFLAKHFSWVSRFGAILDPLADKALLVLTMAILTYNGVISWLLLTVVFARDISIVLGGYYYHYRLGPFEMQPSYLSKFNTFVQILLVSSYLISLGYRQLPGLYIDTLVLLTYFTTVSSGIHYVWVWGGKFKQAISDHKAELMDKHSSPKSSQDPAQDK
ncbi:CDP-alcohol phosphatidyltransferase family protein [Aliikangiella marina]|uniref:CDP-diacylglycerol--glycerol-3-phosphate 3-phosphatidyltransferase n=1 Tax=Aliikangiella marina TaxID=1712262 RepID=A0A545TIM6_9GAMM|nr:CDP-alcohol phosphatidyltransferase family protein [Aliikangiella marina]TQV77084.1 CDP-alcohol phosphatidyltransferase family protein [Aliikangiella marina]